MPGVWTAPAIAPEFNVGTMLLLTDGAVLAQESGTANWWMLQPDPTGLYVQARWRKVRSARNAPLYFASAVLSDGSVLIAGGEYDNGVEADLCAAELYDPLADQWTDLPTPAGWTAIGDAPCCVLPDGRLLLGSIKDNRCAIFDPASRTWSATGSKLNQTSNEETWTLLPDGSVLTADCFGHPASERYVDGTWQANGSTGVDLVEDASKEIGPAILLPDGRVFAIGASGATALFTPNADRGRPGSWAPGPSFPQENGRPLAAKDAPACLLPNGRVLCVAGPVDGTAATYDGPTVFFEFDPASNALLRLPEQPANAAKAPYEGRMLLLPTGEVAFSDGTPSLRIYRPDGAPAAEWLPQIIQCPSEITAGATCTLTGTQLNGLSQACAYGDDASMATNYPIVRLRSVAPTGWTVFARSFGHSSMAVATGASLQSTRFIVPAGTLPGHYTMSVIANGSASPEQSVVVVAPTERSVRALSATEPTRPVSGKELDLQHELFWRDLNEVHLLIDFVSGRTDKSLADLKGVPDRDDATEAATSSDMASHKVVQRVCEIRFPPEGNSKSKAEQAGFLLTVKDRLNALADPARGVTVAYTAMFAGIVFLPSRYWWRRRLGMKVPEASHEIMASFAREAYPNLVTNAGMFKLVFKFLSIFAIFWAAFTAFTYWDVALGSSILNKIATIDSEVADLSRGRTFIPSVASCQSERTKPPADQKPDNLVACDQLDNLHEQQVTARRQYRAFVDTHQFRHPVGFTIWYVSSPVAAAGSPIQRAAADEWKPTPREQLADTVLTVFTNYIVPVMFGLLGTLAGLIRMIAAKVRESTLSPRDLWISVASVPLGLVAGLTVGLLFRSTDVTAANATAGLIEPVTLPAAAVAFLAGYGADVFFDMLDALKKHIFSLGQGAPANSAAQRTQQ